MINTIQIPTEKDYPELTDIWGNAVRSTHHFLTEADIQFFEPLVLNEYLKSVDLFCIRKDEKILGFIGLSEDKIEMLFVDPVSFGKGIGKTLMQFAVEEKLLKKVDVNEQNEKAVAFYKYLGFEVVARSELDGLGKPFPILSMSLSG